MRVPWQHIWHLGNPQKLNPAERVLCTPSDAPLRPTTPQQHCPPAALPLSAATSHHQLEHEDSSLLRNCRQTPSQVLLPMPGASTAGPWSTQHHGCARKASGASQMCSFQLVTEDKIIDGCLHPSDLEKMRGAVLAATHPALLHSLHSH